MREALSRASAYARRLGVRGIVTVPLLMLAAVLGALGWSGYSGYRGALNAARIDIDGSASTMAERAARGFDVAAAVLDGVVTVAERDLRDSPRDVARLSDVVARAARRAPQLQAIQVVDAEGNLLVDSQGFPAVPRNLADRDYFRHHKNQPGDQPFFVPPAGAGALGFSRRISGPGGAFAGVALATLDPLYFQAGRDKGEEGIALVDAQGTAIVVRPSRVDGKGADDILVATAPLPGHSYGVRVARPRRTVLADWDAAIAWQGVGAAGIVLVLLAVSAVLARQTLCREAAERQLQGSEERLRAVFDTVVDGIVTADDHGVIQSFNAAAERIFGWTAAEVVGRNVSLLMAEPERDTHDGRLAAYRATDRRQVVGATREVLAQRKDGTRFTMELAVSEAGVGPGRILTGIVRDITERKRVERLKSEFVSTVSHELRTPLTSIRGSLGLVAGGAAGQLPDKAHGLVEIARKNAERLVLLVNDILDIEKIESGSMEFHLLPLDMVGLVEQSFESLHAYGAQYGVDFLFVERPASAWVMADGERMMQVCSNLMSNAAKFSPKGGTVEVALRRHGGQVRLIVGDRGPGIPDHFRNRIFERFAQAETADARAKGGTGLGLAITKAIVEIHSGRIGFDNRDGRGASFWVDLPEYRRDPAVQATVPSPAAEEREDSLCVN